MNPISKARRRILVGSSLMALQCGGVHADLVAHFALDELPGSGDTVADTLGKNHGTLIGAANVIKGVPSHAPALGTAYDFALRGGADLGNGKEVRPIDQFTMTWWTRPDTLDPFDRIYETLSGIDDHGNGMRIDLGPDRGDRMRVLLRDGNGSTNTQHTHSRRMRNDGTWYFVAVRYDSTAGDGSALKLTVLEGAATTDAATIGAATESPTTLGTGPLDLHDTGAFLAADDTAANDPNDFGGGLDDFAIFQTGDRFGILSDAELAEVFKLGALAFDPPESMPAIVSFSSSEASVTAGSSVTLWWEVSASDTVTIVPGVGNVDAQTTDGVGSIPVTPAATTVYTLTATNAAGSTSSSIQVVVEGQILPPSISEFVATNESSLLDGNGRSSDWIEIHNPNLAPLDLSGYYLTDDATNLVQWPFPAGTIVPGGAYLVVFASQQAINDYVDPGGNLHTNFALNSSGEYLALVAPDGIRVLTEFSPTYPAQQEDVSYGVNGFFLTPTPGATNANAGVAGFVMDTTFSIDRGFYEDPISVAITSATPGAEIYYTTDGSEPSPANGVLYTGPVEIATTTTLRAAAFKENFAPTNVDTHTYLFLDHVLRQRNVQRGYPTVWAGEPAHYQMDPDIVDDPVYGPQMIDALKVFPTLSVAIDRDHMFGPQGLYQHPQSQGDAWERPVSAELIIPDRSEPGFQLNAGMRIQGGSSRNPDIPKHSLSLRFRRQYGAGKLNYPMFADAPFGDSAVEEFDFLQLRAGFNFAWPHRHYYQARHAQYNRDQWVNDLYLAMGQPGSHGRWVHLYINGLYWGIYHAHERPDGDFMASYFGGESEDYDALSSGNAVSGDTAAWNAMFAIANGNIADPRQYERIQQRFLDVDSLIDYMLLNFFVGNTDWDGHNWRAARKRTSTSGYLMLPWDSEFAISPNGPGVINNPQPLSAALNVNVTGRSGSNRPSGLHTVLMRNAEYLMRFADRAHKHLFNDGALSRTTARAIWEARSSLMDHAIVAESARWGDFRHDVDPGRWQSTDFARFTKNDHYLPDQAWIMDNYIPRRSGVLLGQLRARGLYPATLAPTFQQHGGPIPMGEVVPITNPNPAGTIYYTLDGTDPRDPNAGGDLVAAAAIPYADPPVFNQSGPLLARVLNGGEWSALNEAFFLAGTIANSANLGISELMYNPSGPSEDTEFVELVNLSTTETIELGHAQFVAGISFTFPPNTRLAPGHYILVVANRSAFEAEYGTGFTIAGEFSGSLDNDGEQLILRDALGNEILEFTYNDGPDWPAKADGDGASLVLRTPSLASGLDDPLSWRDSTAPGGNPESSDAATFTGDPSADDDRDGLVALLEYALGTSDADPSSRAESLVPALDPVGHLTITIRVNLLASDLDTHLEHSGDLVSWTALTGFERLSITRDAANGTALIVYRSIDPAHTGPEHDFLRRRVAVR